MGGHWGVSGSADVFWATCSMLSALVLLALPAALRVPVRVPVPALRPAHAARLRGGATMAANPGVAVLVEVEVKEDRVSEFLKVMEADAVGVRHTHERFISHPPRKNS